MMDITALLKWLEDTGFATYIRGSLLFFPLIEAAHVLALSLVVGSIMIFDLRLLGLASANRSVKRVENDILKSTWFGFGLVVLTGSLMFITNARVYYNNGFFRAKMLMLLLAGINMFIFERTDKRTMQHWDKDTSAPPTGKIVATLSLAFWISIIVLGRIIGFTTTHVVAAPPAGNSGVNFDDFLGGAPAGNGAQTTPPPASAPKH